MPRLTFSIARIHSVDVERLVVDKLPLRSAVEKCIEFELNKKTCSFILDELRPVWVLKLKEDFLSTHSLGTAS